MKKIVLSTIIALILFGSCKKEDKCPYTESTATAPTAERIQLADYLSAASVTPMPTEHPSGVFYNIITPGTGASSPNICSGITVKYTGTFFPSGVQFDASNDVNVNGVTFALGQLITGWQKVLPLLKTGGKIIIYVPPSLGYGPYDIRDQSGAVIMPGNSYLRFEIELVSIQ